MPNTGGKLSLEELEERIIRLESKLELRTGRMIQDREGHVHTDSSSWMRFQQVPPSAPNLVRGYNLVANSSSTDASNYTTASISPGANRLILAAVASTFSSLPNAPTLSGNGLTWVQIATITFNTVATPLSRLTVFRALGAAPTTGAVTIAFAGQVQLNCLWGIAEFTNVDTSGTNGSGAVVQSATNRGNAATNLSVTLAAFASFSNATYGAFSTDLNEAVSSGLGFSSLSDGGTSTPTQRRKTEWRNENDTLVDATATNPADWGGIAIEIRNTTVIGAQNTYFASQVFAGQDTGENHYSLKDILYAVPFYLPRNQAVDLISINVDTPVAASSARLGIYASTSTTLYPSDLILDAGTVSTATAGIKSIILSSAPMIAGLKWLVLIFDTTDVVIRGPRQAEAWGILGIESDDWEVSAGGWIINSTFGPLPSTFPSDARRQKPGWLPLIALSPA
mgnify:CR=1 FL=1